MIAIDNKTISNWAEWWEEDDPEAAIAQYASFKTVMTPDEKKQIDELIAAAQMNEDPDADATDAALVTRCLIDNGFHPAFEFNAVISGQATFDRMKAASGSPFKP